MSVYFNAGSNERFVSPTTLSLSATATTFTGRAVAGVTGGSMLEARAGSGTTVIQASAGFGNLSVYNGSTAVNIAEPAAGTVYSWYIKLGGAGAGAIEVGLKPAGGSLSTTTTTLVNNSTIDRMWIGGDPFDPTDLTMDAFKVFASALSSGRLTEEMSTFEPWTAAYIWLPMTAGTVAACALDSSGNGRDFTVSGSPAIVTTPAGGHVLTCSRGSYALTGQTAGLKRALKVAAAQGAYALTGQTATLSRTRRLVAAQASYSLSGQSATLTYSGAAARTLTAAQGAFALSGQAAALKATRKIAAAQGSFTRTGQTAALRVGRALVCATGSYALSGQAANLVYVRRIRFSVEAGAYALTGQSADLDYSADDGWNRISPVAETWSTASPIAEAWTPVPSTSETWSAA